ncbi:MAG: NACHT domain-containing protein [Blastocatellia bacterium]
MEQKQILRIVVASPSDVKAERDLLPNVMEELNRGVAADRGLRLELSRWETDTHPGFHPEGPQGLIDPFLQITDCDLLIGVFWKRFGTPTADGQTGTEHEINLAINAWKEKCSPQIFVYFNQKSYTPKSKAEIDQWGAVLEFQRNFPKEGLWWPYKGKAQFERFIRNHLTNFIRTLPKPDNSSAPQTAEPISPERLNERIKTYRDNLKQNVGRVYLLGETESRELQKVFVELTINESYSRPTANSEWMGMWDAELRKRYAPFGFRLDEERKFEPDEERDAQRRIKPEELLKRRSPAVIAGAPGCGKSTLMRWLALQVCDENSKRIPIFVELKGLSQKSFKSANVRLESVLFDHAAESLKKSDATEGHRKQLREEFARRLKSGEIVALLDGLDEVRGWEHFTHLCDAINRFAEDHGHNLIIISSRPFALRDRHFRNAEEMEIAPFNRDQIALFLDHYYGEKEGRKLLPKLMHPDLRDLVSVPALIGAIVRRIRQGGQGGQSGKVETDRLKLYEAIVADLSGKFDSAKNVSRFKQNDDAAAMRRQDFLAQLAFTQLFNETLDQEKNAKRLAFSTGDIKIAAQRFCRENRLNVDPYELAADVIATPLLAEMEEDVWKFSHLTLQEYLAARTLATHPDCESIFVRACFHPLLVEMETLPMALGRVRNPDRLYETLEQLPESLDYKLLRLRARGLGATWEDQLPPEFQKRLRLRPLNDSLRKIFNQHYPPQEESLAQESGAAHNIIVVRPDRPPEVTIDFFNMEPETGLIDILIDSPKLDSRKRVTSEPGGAGSKLDLRESVHDLAHYPGIQIQEVAARLLARIGSERAVEALLKALLDAQHSSVRVCAAEALCNIAAEKAEKLAAGLMLALGNEKESVRRKAAEVVGYYVNEVCLAELERLAATDKSDEVKDAARAAVEKVKRKLRYFGANAANPPAN